MRPVPVVPLVATLAAIALGAVTSSQADEPPAAPTDVPTLVTALVPAPAPAVDGMLHEAHWEQAATLRLPTGTGKGDFEIRLQALVTEQRHFLAVSWPDVWLPTPEQEAAATCPAFHATLGSDPPTVWTWAGGIDEPAPDADVAGFCADGGCSVELSRPIASPRFPQKLLMGKAWPLTIQVRGKDGQPVTVQALLRMGPWIGRWTFEDDALGGAPKGLGAALAGKGAAPAWVVRAAGKSKVLVQESRDPTDARFPLALAAGVVARDVDLSVRFQALDGFKDRAAGLVWRVKDAGNHYILRANALERNVVLYKMQGGLRVDLPPVGREADYGVKVEFDPAAWHVLRVVAVGDRFEAYLDGRLLFHVKDATFAEPGTVGLWTKSDSVTAFDDLTLVSLDTPSAGR